MDYNDPLYFFTLPGLILCAGGLYIGFNLLRTFYIAGSIDFVRNIAFEPMVLMVLITFIGMGMVFTGILLHLISGLLRYLQE